MIWSQVCFSLQRQLSKANTKVKLSKALRQVYSWEGTFFKALSELSKALGQNLWIQPDFGFLFELNSDSVFYPNLGIWFPFSGYKYKIICDLLYLFLNRLVLNKIFSFLPEDVGKLLNIIKSLFSSFIYYLCYICDLSLATLVISLSVYSLLWSQQEVVMLLHNAQQITSQFHFPLSSWWNPCLFTCHFASPLSLLNYLILGKSRNRYIHFPRSSLSWGESGSQILLMMCSTIFFPPCCEFFCLFLL